MTTDIYDDVERQNSALDNAVSSSLSPQHPTLHSNYLNLPTPAFNSSATRSLPLDRRLLRRHGVRVKHLASHQEVSSNGEQ